MKHSNVDPQLIEHTLQFAAENTLRPLNWVRGAYDWGHGELEGIEGPRVWQTDILQVIQDHLNSPQRFQPLCVAVASGHGIGKSALISMVSNWAMETCEQCRVVITANTEQQLRTKTAPEVRKWFKRSIGSWMYDLQATTIGVVGEPEWRLDFSTWSKENTEAFAGLHNKGKRIIVIYDEASAIEDVVWEVTEGALTDEDTEIIWIAFGNPTRNSGRFRECFRRYRDRWIHRNIDSSTVEGTNKTLFEGWKRDYGFESDFYKVRVRGVFPDAGARQFISGALVDAAFGKHLRKEQYAFAPVVLGVDPAWTGDDEFVIVKRQGLKAEILGTWRKNDDDVLMASIIARLEDEHQADAVFVDLGYGTGIVSAGKAMGRSWQLVPFGGKASDPGVLNKRAEMWWLMGKWLAEGASIPPDDTLREDLVGPETLPRLDGKIALESKDQMKDRGVPSPNRADALALTFAYPVTKRDRLGVFVARKHETVQVDYDPFA